MIRSALLTACALVAGVAVATAAAGAAAADPGPSPTSGPGSPTTPVQHGPLSCVGAAVFDQDPGVCPTQTSGPLSPTIADAPKDMPDSDPRNGRPDCQSHSPTFTMVVCGFDAKTSKVNIALVGNSHAAQWMPSLQRVADAHHWHTTTYLASSCAFANIRQAWNEPVQTNCLNLVRAIAKRLVAGSYNLIVMSNKISQLAAGAGPTLADSYQPYYAGYWSFLNMLHKAHKRVLVIHDTPAPIKLIPSCLQDHLSDYPACDGPRATWESPDPATAAAASLHDPRIVAADPNGHICGPTICPAVVGGDIVYRDGSHLTATYNRTLEPWTGYWMTHTMATP